WFAKAGRTNTIVNKVHFNFRDFLDADQAVRIEILLFRFSVLKGQVAEQRVAESIDNSTRHLLQRATLVYHDATIGTGINFLQYRTSIFHRHFCYLRHVRTVRKIYTESLRHVFFLTPLRLFCGQFDNAFHSVDIVLDLSNGSTLSLLQQLKPECYRILVGGKRDFIEK